MPAHKPNVSTSLSSYVGWASLIEPLSLNEGYLDVTENKTGLLMATRATFEDQPQNMSHSRFA